MRGRPARPHLRIYRVPPPPPPTGVSYAWNLFNVVEKHLTSMSCFVDDTQTNLNDDIVQIRNFLSFDNSKFISDKKSFKTLQVYCKVYSKNF